MWYYSPTKKQKLIYQVRANTYDIWVSGQYWKYCSNIFLFHPLGPFPSKKDPFPLIFLFWSPPTAVHIFDASNKTVPGLYIFFVFYDICLKVGKFESRIVYFKEMLWDRFRICELVSLKNLLYVRHTKSPIPLNASLRLKDVLLFQLQYRYLSWD